MAYPFLLSFHFRVLSFIPIVKKECLIDLMDALIEPNSSGYNALWRAAAMVVFSQYLRRLADIADKATAFAVVEKSRKYIGKTCITRAKRPLCYYCCLVCKRCKMHFLVLRRRAPEGAFKKSNSLGTFVNFEMG